MKLKLLLSIVFLVLSGIVNAQTWTNAKPVTPPDLRPLEMFCDNAGNMYVFGNTADPMQRSWYFAEDAEFSRYDASGTRVNHIKWAGVVISEVVYDNTFFYLSGTFTGTVTLGSFVLQSAGDNDVFVAKMDAAGQVLFAKRSGGTNKDQSGAVGLAADGNILFAAAFQGPATIGTTLIPAGKEYLLWSLVDKSTGDFINTKLTESIIVNDTIPSGPEKNVVKIRRSGNEYMALFVTWTKETMGKDTLRDKGFSVYLVKCDINMNITSYTRVGNTVLSYYGYSLMDLELDNAGNPYTLDFSSGKYGGTGHLSKFNTAASAMEWTYSGGNYSSEYVDVCVDANGIVLAGHEDWIPYGEDEDYGNEVIIKFKTDKTEQWRYKNRDLRITKILKQNTTIYTFGSFTPQSISLGNTTLTEADPAKRWFIGEMSDGAVAGISENDIAGIHIGPNPSRDILNITTSGDEGTIHFYSISGQLITTVEIQKTNQSLDISTFPTGIVFYKVQNKAGAVLKNDKLMIVR